MTDFDDPHVPTPEFQAELKQALTRAYRAERQFDVPRRTRWSRIGRIAGIAAGAVFCLTIGLVLGAVGGYASAAGFSVSDRQVPSSRMTTRRQFTQNRLAIARANYEAARRDLADGKASTADVQRAKAEVDTMEANIAQLDVDMAGGEVTQPPPTNVSLFRNPVRAAITALTCGAAAAAGQATAQAGVPVVGVTAASAKTSTSFGAVLGLRELPDGRLLVNDAGRRQLKVFDRSLATATTALDSISGTPRSYGDYPATILPYLGDSTIFVGRGEEGVGVLDAKGTFVRALALPTYRDNIVPFPMPFVGPKAADHRGRLFAQGGFAVRSGGIVADSVLLYRADLQTREVEPVGVAHYEKGARNRNDPPENGNRVVTTIRQPVETVDSWTVLSDGTLAMVRGQDYHVDWVMADGTKSGTSKLPFDWKRLTDDDKQRLADSAKVVWDSLMAIRNKRMAAPARQISDDPNGPPPGSGRSGGGGAPPGQQGSIQKMISVPINEIPDFYPPIRENSAMADLDGNLWILPTTSAQSQRGELVCDVVNPRQGLFERVRVPLGASIAGFGKGGVIYLQTGDRRNGFVIERVKVPAK